MIEGTDAKWIAGFWRRIGAFAIDTIILGVFGFVLGLFLENLFVQIGVWGRLLGFAIALLYFGLLNSRMFDGQTVGKRIAGIRVVNGENKPIDVSRSFARYSVLGVPFFLNGAQFTNESMMSFWVYPVSIAVFGGLLSAGYLYIFNRVTRQSLHDLAVGTYVVHTDAEKSDIGTLWRPHLIVVAALFLASGALPAFTSQLLKNEPFVDLYSSAIALTEHPAVYYATVTSGRTTRTSINQGTTTISYLAAVAVLLDDSVSDEKLARQLAISLVNNHSASQRMDVIQIVLSYGYDIGIASKWRNHSHVFDPADLVDGN